MENKAISSAFKSILVASLLIWTVTSLDAPQYVYHNYEALTQFLEGVASNYPDIADLRSIGKSVEDRELWVMMLGTRDPEVLRPALNLVGNMHGNEVVGREVLVHFIYYLVSNYNSNATIKYLLDNYDVHILTSMNPDGFEISPEGVCRPLQTQGRLNANGYDLNRNFPDFFVNNNVTRQPETLAVMKWGEENNFILHANLHGGVMVVNYPYDNYIGGISPEKPSSPAQIAMSRDNDMLSHISRVYSLNHPRMSTIEICNDTGGSTHFPPEGITNGALWYPTSGCMQDWFYIKQGAPAVTLEISCCKHPPADELEFFWNENRESLFHFLQQADLGVRGVVSDPSSGEPLSGVNVEIVGRDHPRLTTSQGEYWRVLLPGSYTAKFTKSCYEIQEVTFTVPQNTHVRVDIELVPVSTTGGSKTIMSSLPLHLTGILIWSLFSLL